MRGLTLTAQILVICLEICLVTSLAAGRRRQVCSQRSYERCQRSTISVRITFEEAVFGCEKELDMVFKRMSCPKCNGTGAKPGTSPETCTKCGGKGQVVFYTAVSVWHGSEM